VKIYSDTLTDEDIQLALTNGVNSRVAGHCGFETFKRRTGRVNLAQRCWDVLLFRAGSKRPFASGTRGAGDQGAATWDDYGYFLEALYQVDPAMKVRVTANYNGRDHFHRQTHDAYRPIVTDPATASPYVASEADPGQLHRPLGEGNLLRCGERMLPAGTWHPVEGKHGKTMCTACMLPGKQRANREPVGRAGQPGT
jgi:hypothetical protein